MMTRIALAVLVLVAPTVARAEAPCAKASAQSSVEDLFEIGDCHEKANRFASAWRAYTRAFTAAVEQSESDRAALAKERIAAVQPKLNRVIVDVENVPGARVSAGGESVTAPEALVLDADQDVELRVTGNAKKPWVQQFHVPAAPGDSHVYLRLEEAAPAALAERSGNARTLPIIVGGAGLVLAGLGTGLLFVAHAQGDDAVSRANAANAARDSAAYDAAEDARNDALGVQNLGFGAIALGVIAMGTAAWLFLKPGQKAQRVGFAF
jgi:hypothetical protein